MPGLTLTKLQITEGVWTGRLSGTDEDPPQIEVTHLDQPVPDIRLVADRQTPGTWTLSIPIPVSALSEGVQTLLIRHQPTGARLGHVTIVTGEPLEDDIRAELDLLRAELDLLKKAFRRHASQTAG